MIREITFFENHYIDFYASLPTKVQGKIDSIMVLIASIRMVPEKFLKHISGTDGLYELRIDYGGNAYRIFCIFDKGNSIILLSGFQKKAMKIPGDEIAKAKLLQKKYNEFKIH